MMNLQTRSFAEACRLKVAGAVLALIGIQGFASVARPDEAAPPWPLARRITRPTLPEPAAAPPSTLTVPAETEVDVELLSGIHTRVSHVDDPVRARLLQPLRVGGVVALPTGTLIDGRITRIQSPGRMRRPAELAMRFELITLPDGQAEPIRATLTALDRPSALNSRLDPEGFLKGGRTFSWRTLAGSIMVMGALATVKSAFAAPAALWPAGGAALLGYELLWSRGSEVHLPPDTRCRIRLSYPLTIRIPS